MKKSAMNKAKHLLCALLAICLVSSLTIPSMAVVSDTDKSSLTEAQQAVIRQATENFYAAKAAGDTAGMLAAHQVAEAVRNSAGYTGGSDGSAIIPLVDVVALQFPTGTGATDRERTLSSLTKIDGVWGLYMMTYYGDYDDIVDTVNQQWIDTYTTPAGCSLISLTADKDHPVYGRNFDNPPGTGILLTHYVPEDKYESVAFSRFLDLGGLGNDFEVDSLDEAQKEAILNAAYYVPCGINEKGVAVALAYNPPGDSTEGYEGKEVFVTGWIREILDNAKDVDEAVEICKTLKVFDMGIDILTHHILIADAQGNSVIAEFDGGDWHFMTSVDPYQVVTNSPLYNISEADRDAACWRYRTATKMLSDMNGSGTWLDAMQVLKAVQQHKSTSETIWSFTSDLSARTLNFCLYGDFSSIYQVEF